MSKKKHPEHVNHERWLVSYADFITLLFAFFTALYAMSTVDAKKAGQMVSSTRAAFNLDIFNAKTAQPGRPTVMDMTNQTSPRPNLDAPNELQQHTGMLTADGVAAPATLTGVYNEVRKLVYVDKIDGISVRVGRTGVVISLKDAAFFTAGRTDLNQKALPQLDKIAERVLKTHMNIRIEGHTDDTPVKGKRYRSNWELSTFRAVSVVNYMMQQFAYPPDSMSVAGHGSYQPIDNNDTPEGRAANRRVDIVLISPRAPTTESAQEAGSAATLPAYLEPPPASHGGELPESHAAPPAAAPEAPAPPAAP